MRPARLLIVVGVLLVLGTAVRVLVVGGWPSGALLEIRGGRALSAVAVGGALALAGVLLQTLLRNPLASPGLLGLSSGAGLGVTVAAYIAYRATGVIAPVGSLGGGYAGPAAVAGAGVTLALVYWLSQRRGLVDPLALVLVGVIVGIMAGAGTQLVQRLLPDGGIALGRMLVGTISDEADWATIGVVLGLVVVCGGVMARAGPMLDAMAMDDESARSVGVPVGRLRAMMLVSAGLLSAGAVMLAGPVGFVGLVVPHAVRMVMGPSHRPLLIGSALLGAGAIVWADVLVALVRLPSGRLPLGVITAMVGGPVFVLLLRRVMRG